MSDCPRTNRLKHMLNCPTLYIILCHYYLKIIVARYQVSTSSYEYILSIHFILRLTLPQSSTSTLVKTTTHNKSYVAIIWRMMWSCYDSRSTPGPPFYSILSPFFLPLKKKKGTARNPLQMNKEHNFLFGCMRRGHSNKCCKKLSCRTKLFIISTCKNITINARGEPTKWLVTHELVENKNRMKFNTHLKYPSF